MVRRALVPAVLAVGAVYTISTMLALSLRPLPRPIGIGIAIDLTLTSAVLFWLLAVRPGHVGPAALIRVVVIGAVLARLLVGLAGLGVVVIGIELALLGYLAVRVRRIVGHARALMRAGQSLPTALETALQSLFPVAAVARVLAIEISMVVLAITGWFRSPPAGWTMHRQSGVLLVLGVLSALAVVEAVLVHLVVVRVAPTVAIVLTALSAYSLLWLIGFAQSVRLSPLRFIGAAITIERGISRRTVVPLRAIRRALSAPSERPAALDLSYGEPNVLLELTESVEVHRIFGRPRSATHLLLSIDGREAFFAALAERVDDGVVERAP